MKTIILLFALFGTVSVFSEEDKTSTKVSEVNQEHIQMHERMAAAHQQAADCLKSGKSEEKCRKAFHEMCQEAGGSDKCGSWMMHHKMRKKDK